MNQPLRDPIKCKDRLWIQPELIGVRNFDVPVRLRIVPDAMLLSALFGIFEGVRSTQEAATTFRSLVEANGLPFEGVDELAG